MKTACLFYIKKKITWRIKKEVNVLNKNKKILNTEQLQK